uniref:Uncharacterized protein n=1 Tax=Rhizophora mucronata TaxID=61149 RepID=A0A2P2P3B4_RHIMU
MAKWLYVEAVWMIGRRKEVGTASHRRCRLLQRKWKPRLYSCSLLPVPLRLAFLPALAGRPRQ